MKPFPELAQVEQIAKRAETLGRVKIEHTVTYRGRKFPLYSFIFGSEEPTAPTLAIVGGVHGLEKIGTRVALAYLDTFCRLLRWDSLTQAALKDARIVFYPLTNPGGMCWGMRPNPNGVDIMRNAPIEAEHKPMIKMLAGQRVSRRLPWYRGEGLEDETRVLMEVMKRELWQSKRAVSLDIHSGYGTVDRLWFPWAKARKPIPHIAEVIAIKDILENTYPNNVYCVEPQSIQYTAGGDVWDYLYEEHHKEGQSGIYIPFSLEMGSWIWIKKNPRQLFTLLGAFNPVMPHRYKRTLRRHLRLFDFLTRVVLSSHWTELSDKEREQHAATANQLWFK